MRDIHILPWWQQLLLGMAFATVVLAFAFGVAVTLRWLLS